MHPSGALILSETTQWSSVLCTADCSGVAPKTGSLAFQLIVRVMHITVPHAPTQSTQATQWKLCDICSGTRQVLDKICCS